jgi:membrane associated rhomboid family serine protease
MVLTIIIITVLISVVAFNSNDLFYRLKFSPFLILHSKQWYRFFTYGMVHAGWMHLLINMFVLYSFSNSVLEAYTYFFYVKGYFYFALLYIGGLVFSVTPAFGKHKNHPEYNAVGASGAVSAIVFASILFEPLSKIYLFFIPIGIPAFIFGVIYLVYSFYMAKNARDNIGHDAHFWGAVYGVIYTIAIKPTIVLAFWEQIQSLWN